MQADEIKKIIVLPILYRDCELPQLLSDRKYADFRSDYDEGFMALCAALGLKRSEALSENKWRLFMDDELEGLLGAGVQETGQALGRPRTAIQLVQLDRRY
mgnify:CR=1 FL=1